MSDVPEVQKKERIFIKAEHINILFTLVRLSLCAWFPKSRTARSKLDSFVGW